MPGWASALARGWPSRPRGLTSVASTASCSPCHRAARCRQPRCARRPARVHISQAHIPGHTCASLAAHPGKCALKGDGTRGKEAGGGTRRSVITKHRSSGRRQAQARGASGSGRRSRRRRRTRTCALGSVTSSCVGRTVRAREECGPACVSSSGRAAGERLEKNVSNARSSQSHGSSQLGASAGGRMASSQLGTV